MVGSLYARVRIPNKSIHGTFKVVLYYILTIRARLPSTTIFWNRCADDVESSIMVDAEFEMDKSDDEVHYVILLSRLRQWHSAFWVAIQISSPFSRELPSSLEGWTQSWYNSCLIYEAVSERSHPPRPHFHHSSSRAVEER